MNHFQHHYTITSTLRPAISIIVLILTLFKMAGQEQNAIVADASTHTPLPSASIFDRQGKAIGISNINGRIPYIPSDSYPITIRYLGFKETVVRAASHDTIFLKKNFSELPEVVIESRQYKVMHMLAYVREYSTLTTYTDTVFLFREKMVDYMLIPAEGKKIKFKGWSNPRILTSKSYYRFTNAQGLDSVSDISNHHFSWSDWVGVAPAVQLPPALRDVEYGTDTIRGKYSPTELWTKNNDEVSIDVNVLADTISRKWVPNLSSFFRNDLDFENFRVRFRYGNVAGNTILPMDLTGYSFNVESNGRGHNMFRFNSVNEPFFVSTYAEVYILDKEYITIKEAKKWDSRKFNTDDLVIFEPSDAPDLQPSIKALIERVNNINTADIRLKQTPDHNLAGRDTDNRNFRIEYRALNILKALTGISAYKAKKNFNSMWDRFRRETMRKNNLKDKK